MTAAESMRVLHAVRLLGFVGADDIATRAGAAPDASALRLLEAEQQGLVQHVAFADSAGWALTQEGTRENERQLADELRTTGGRAEVEAVHRAFRPLNARLLRAVTDWQIVPGPGGRLDTNDHSDRARDARILDELGSLGAALAPLLERLVSVLPRFAGYDERFASALERARTGEAAWVDGMLRDSCHRVWFELHEDLLATLGIDRAEAEAAGDGPPTAP